MVNALKYSVYNSTYVGATHIKAQKACQDFSASGKGKNYSYGVVCDGHGGEDYFRSDRGARFAAEVFVSCLEDNAFLKKMSHSAGKKERDSLLGQFIKSVITRWNIAVETDLLDYPLTQEELDGASDRARAYYEVGRKLSSIYGTTLIGFAFIGDVCFGVQIGDGKCVAFNGNGFFEPIPPDGECFLNITTSLSSPEAYDKFRVFTRHADDEDFPRGVFLCTDGVSDSFTEENFMGFYSLALNNINSSEDDSPIDELFDYLPTLSERGSGDDMSLCIMIERGYLNEQ